MPSTMTGRRVADVEAIELPGDYAGPFEGYTADKSAVFFLLPVARDEGAHRFADKLHHATSPPHVFRECPDGSLEIRASILAHDGQGGEIWHGYLDEGHYWRSV